VANLKLPNVTLLLIETRCHALAKLALDDCMAAVDFGDVVIFSNDFATLWTSGARHVTVRDWEDKVGWSRCSWLHAPLYLKTSHSLSIQWDAWVLDPTAWLNKFLDYDYIGSIWPKVTDGHNVGNGGFSLRSKRLTDYVIEHSDKFPIDVSNDDWLFSRGDYRERLEAAGFRWAPTELARIFSFEMERPTKTFGFHHSYNFSHVLEGERLEERRRLVRETKMPFSPEWYLRTPYWELEQ
jgi:hypothetical protein